jgi:multiple sugar transport system permease protein
VKAGASNFISRALNKEPILGVVLALPLFVFIFGIIAVPFFQSIYISFTDKIAGKPEADWVGWKNYIETWTDPVFYEVFLRTFVYAVGCVFMKLVLGIVLALSLNDNFRGRSFFRTALLIPWAMPGMVVASTWKWMYDGSFGIINSLLLQAGWIETPVPWLSSTQLSLVSVMIVNIWRGVPFFLYGVLGALQTIDRNLYEAAEIDGAGPLRRFTAITLPCISPAVSVSVLLSLIWTFNDFDNVFILTGGGPIYSSAIMSIYSFETAFMKREFGRSVAISLSIAPFIIGTTIFARKLQKDLGV